MTVLPRWARGERRFSPKRKSPRMVANTSAARSQRGSGVVRLIRKTKAARTAHPGTQFAVEHFDAFTKSIVPRWLTSRDFRLAFTSGVSANQTCFERELLDHFRLVFENAGVG